jgi:low affinity Fe/Cu permease
MPGPAPEARRASASETGDPGPLGVLLTKIGAWTSRPSAFLVVVVYCVVWVVADPHSLNFHSVATVITWFMTLLIQRAEHRDTQGLHAKLDELLRAQPSAQTGMSHIDELEPEAIEKQRRRAQDHPGGKPPPPPRKRRPARG